MQRETYLSYNHLHARSWKTATQEPSEPPTSGQYFFCSGDKDSSARLGAKHYREEINASLDVISSSGLAVNWEMMTLGEHEQDQMEMEMDSTEMWYIMTQKQQLQIRHSLLVEMKEFLEKNNFREGNQSVMRQNCMRKGKLFKSCNVARRVSQNLHKKKSYIAYWKKVSHLHNLHFIEWKH